MRMYLRPVFFYVVNPRAAFGGKVKKSKKMAYNIHWQVKFMPLTGSQLVVNIYDEAPTQGGWPIQLIPGAKPFETQEDDTSDVFTPVRTQSGYLRIVDTGMATDANGQSVSFNWRDLIPAADTDRPVTLTRGTTVMWQGFIQSQNFGCVLFGNPQERAFPLMCCLSAMEGYDVDYQHTDIENFAYLLNHIVSCIETPAINLIRLSGGWAAAEILKKKIDWQHFVAVAANDKMDARYSLLQCLEDMCRFWGWTARTWRDRLFLVCHDDGDMNANILNLTRKQLATLAGGTQAGSVSALPATRAFPLTLFRSTANEDFQERGPQKAKVQADGDSANSEVVFFSPDAVITAMKDAGWQNPTPGTGDHKGDWLQYTNNLLAFNYIFFTGSAISDRGSFNVRSFISGGDGEKPNQDAVIRILAKYNGSNCVQLDSIYAHAFAGGMLTIHGSIFYGFDKFEKHEENSRIGLKYMYVRVGIGPSRNSSETMWYNGLSWVAGTPSVFKMSIGNSDNVFRPTYTRGSGSSTTTIHLKYITISNPMVGRLFVDFLGSDDIGIVGDIIQIDTGNYVFDIVDFNVTFERSLSYILPGETIGTSIVKNVTRADIREYTAENQNRSDIKWDADCIYASDNNMLFGYGVILNVNGSYMSGFIYSGTTPETPEQHLANRVADYWQRSRRRLKMEVSNGSIVGNSDPNITFTFDSMRFMTVSFDNDWRNAKLIVTLMELEQ